VREANHSPHFVLRLRISLAIPPFLHAFMSCKGATLSLLNAVMAVILSDIDSGERGNQTCKVNSFVSTRRGEGRTLL